MLRKENFEKVKPKSTSKLSERNARGTNKFFTCREERHFHQKGMPGAQKRSDALNQEDYYSCSCGFL